MPNRKSTRKLAVSLTLSFVFAAFSALRAEAQASVVFTFTGSNGSGPEAGVIFDSAGNMYSTAQEGGTDDDGIAYELSAQTGGGYAEQILHSFTTGGSDGNNPRGSSLTMDAHGNLYGITTFGGAETVGVAFALSKASGAWEEKIIHTFGRFGGEGFYPEGTLVEDHSGNFFGVTSNGGAYGYGTVYEITPELNGTWTTQFVYSFNANGHDGTNPYGTLIFDAAGNLYGTTELGGRYGEGTVFELSPKAGGGWMEKLLYNFNVRTDANHPVSGVVMDASGNIYGTASSGGTYDEGAIYRLSPRSAGGWQETILYSLNRDADGYEGPTTGLTFDTVGNLYGVTEVGGVNFAGEIYVLTPSAGGIWTESTFYSFSDTGGPAFPESGLTLGPDGNFYGTTTGGGSASLGTVYSIAP